VGSNPTLSASLNFGILIVSWKNERNSKVMKTKLFKRIVLLGVAGLLVHASVAAGQSHVNRRRARKGIICGNPKVACKTTVTFEPNDLPFQVPKNAVILDTELFYAIILKSLDSKEEDCAVFVPETERLTAQSLFPDNKVFTSRCADPGSLFYTNVNPNFRIMAVYGGKTLADAKRMQNAVKATGKYPGANIRRMSSGYNGT
jgi:hypothetical protein